MCVGEVADENVYQVFMAQGLVYFFRWYLRRDRKSDHVDTEQVVGVEQPVSTHRGDHESDVTAHDNDEEEVGRVSAVRAEEKGAIKSG